MMNALELAAELKDVPVADRTGLIDELTSEYAALIRDWNFWARPEQLPPPGDWRTWLILAGRGFGKTRTGAEWVRAQAESRAGLRIALIAGTMGDARSVMVEGESGILAVCPPRLRPRWEPSLQRLSWRNGTRAFLYSAEEPARLRGPQHDLAWCDELAKWHNAADTWDNLQLGLRLGERPRALVTTTPRPIPLLKAMLADPAVAVVRGRTRDNCDHLPESFLAHVEAGYGGTRLGRQELDGELIEDVEGALWTRRLIEEGRRAVPQLRRVVVGVDPPAGTSGDACGIVAAGLGDDGRAYVLDDGSVQGLHPEGWARMVAALAARWQADCIIAEVNNGGAMVTSVLHAVDAALPIKAVRAAHGKVARAEPVASLYAAGKVFHGGCFPALEDEMCGLMAGGGYAGPGRSPDRADALVWALTELMLGRANGEPAVKMI